MRCHRCERTSRCCAEARADEDTVFQRQHPDQLCLPWRTQQPDGSVGDMLLMLATGHRYAHDETEYGRPQVSDRHCANGPSWHSSRSRRLYGLLIESEGKLRSRLRDGCGWRVCDQLNGACLRSFYTTEHPLGRTYILVRTRSSFPIAFSKFHG